MTTTLEPITATATTWLLDTSHTNVEFAVKHLMIATVKGRFADVTGKLTGSFDDPSNFQLEVNIATESVDTRQAQRDAHLRSSDFFDTCESTRVGRRTTPLEFANTRRSWLRSRRTSSWHMEHRP